ncbi:hypothetical protein D3C76_703700 [compost metagenome]
MAAADAEDALAFALGKALHVRTDTPQQGGLVPGQWLLEFGVPGAFSVVPQGGLVSFGTRGVLDAMAPGQRIFGHGVTAVVQCQQGFALVGVQSHRVGFRVVGDRDGLFVRRQVGLPIAGFAIGAFHGVEAVDELHDFPGQDRAKFADGDHATCRESAQLHCRFNHPHEMLEGFVGQALCPVDNTFEGVIQQLIGRVSQHQLAKERDERQRNEGCDVQQRRGDFREGVP